MTSIILGPKYLCLDNPMHRGVLWAIVHRVAKSRA